MNRADAVASGNYGFAGSSTAFQDYASTVNLDEIVSNTKWNPPLPTVLSNPEFRKYNNPKGWFAPDPMRITGYELKPPDQTPETLPGEPEYSTGSNAAGFSDSRDTYYDQGQFRDTFEFDKRTYGFRFLFNPTTVAEAYTNTNQVDPISFVRSLSETSRPLLSMQSGASMNVDLLLSRIDDIKILRKDNWRDYYTGPMTDEDRDQIMRRGTMYDLEYLFRMCNGKRLKTWWSDIDTADWGVFLPRPILVSIGGGTDAPKIRALISSVSFEHALFGPGMIPILTTVQVRLERLLDQMTRGVLWAGAVSDAYANTQDEADAAADDRENIARRNAQQAKAAPDYEAIARQNSQDLLRGGPVTSKPVPRPPKVELPFFGGLLR